MRNRQVADVLREIADLLEILGPEAAKAPAYRRAAQALENLPRDVDEVRREGRLGDVPGIGPRLLRKVEEILDTGTCAALERLRRQVPAGVLELLQVPGVGPRTAGILFRQLGVASLEDLERAARAGRIRELPGFGARREQAILRGLLFVQESGRRFLLSWGISRAQEVLAAVRGLPGVVRAEAAGSLRRRCQTVGDLDIVVAAERPAEIAERLARLPGAEEVLAAGEARVSVRLAIGMRVDFLVVPPPSFAAALVHFTGSPAHNVRLRALARARGCRLNEYGLFPLEEGESPRGDGRPMYPESEESLYRWLGLSFIPPELREDAGEIEAAAAGRLPVLLELGDIRGDLHVHTQWSDGLDSITAMAEAARALGYEYMAVSDHSQSLAVARGLDVGRLREQWDTIARLNERLAPFRILRSAEVDIRKDGTLDYPDEVLAELDLVTASVHTGFRMDRQEMTRRIVSAMRHPHVHIIGHLTGRLLGRREPYEVDLEALLTAARETGTALEINASPDRLDICDLHARMAREAGVRLAICTDAHAVGSLQDMAFGVAVARRAWVGPESVLNALPLPRLLGVLAEKRRGAPPALQ